MLKLKKVFVLPTIAFCILIFPGCSNPKDANKKNFKIAINKFLEKEPVCIRIPYGDTQSNGRDSSSFPRYIAKNEQDQYLHADRDENQFNTLVDIGLMKVEDSSIEVEQLFSRKKNNIPVHAYSLSDLGKKLVSNNDNSQFCYGIPTVDEVTQFTEPSSMMGMGVTMSYVKYRYHIKDIPPWAKNKKVREAFEKIQQDLSENLDGETTLILSSEGWVNDSEIR